MLIPEKAVEEIEAAITATNDLHQLLISAGQDDYGVNSLGGFTSDLEAMFPEGWGRHTLQDPNVIARLAGKFDSFAAASGGAPSRTNPYRLPDDLRRRYPSYDRKLSADEAVEFIQERIYAAHNLLDYSNDAESPVVDVEGALKRISELRAHITGSNELNEEQKKNALGYLGALEAILTMASPDREAFSWIVARLGKMGERLGSMLLIETAKELVKWGLNNLL